MRIAVDCRFLSLGPSLLSRGIPRYIRQQLRAVLRHDRDNQYLLLHRPIDDPSLLPDEVRQAPNVTLRPFPGETKALAQAAHTLRATEELERWLLRERIDLFHATAPWLPVATVFPRIDVCPVITTIYDLIPSLFQEHLSGIMKDGWVVAIEQLRRSSRLIAISECTARDATLYYEIPSERMDVAYPHAEAFFQPLAADVIEARMKPLRRELGLAPGPFVMTVSFPGFRNKNIETLLEGYRQIPASLRRSLPLVVVGAQGPTAEGLRAACRRLDILPHLVTTGVISDDEICALYNAATMLVVPSRYEGFGMPIVEAMQCGTPVVTTTSASMPEVAGGAAWLVGAEDAPGFARAIETIAGDEARRAEMRRAGFEQVKRFTSDGLGLATLEAYRRAVAPAVSAIAPRERIAMCIRNPAAMDEHLRAQIETADALAADAEVELFLTGDGAPACELLRRFRLHDTSALERIHASRPYDAILRAQDAPAPAASWRATTKTHGERTIAPLDVLPGVADPLGPQPLLQREQARTYLDVATTSFMVSCPELGGTLAEMQMVVLAFADLCHVFPQSWLFVDCDPKTNALPANIAQQAKSFGIESRIRAQVPPAPGTTPSAVAAAADVYLAATDVVVAIASAGKAVSPHVVMRACAAGKAVIVDDSEVWAWLPDDACVRVPAMSFGLILGQTLRALSHDRLRRASMGKAARAAYEREFTLAHMRTRLREALDLPVAPVASIASVAPAAVEVAPVAASAAARDSRLGFNRVCNIEDFGNAELVAEMHEVLPYKVRHFGPSFPRDVEHCKDWEVAMATRTLRHFGALRPDASILGVAAGMEDTIFYLSNHVGEVMTVDRYVQSGVWQLNSPLWMLVTPDWGAPDGCNPDRLVVQHMDARRLRFPDNRFDGIFSSGSIEHFGGLMDVAHSAYEMGRVLKPGGILSLSTVMAIDGPPGRLGGIPGTCLLFQREHLVRYIVEASGLELVDALDTDATPATHAAHRSLEQVLTAVLGNSAAQGLKGLQEDYKYGAFPCLALDWEGFTFDSVHLALRKPLTGWGASNAWARPTPAVEAGIREDYRRLIEDYGAWAPSSTVFNAPVDRPEVVNVQAARTTTRLLRHHVVTLASDLDGLRSEVERHALQMLPTDGASAGLPETWVPIPLTLPNVPPYTLLVDRSEKRDILVQAFLKGLGVQINVVEFSLLRAFVQPGDAVIDAGAHLGSITLPLAAIGCRVLSVEASAHNAALLRASVAYNGFRDVTVVRAAAAAAEGTLSFYSDGAWGWVVPPGEPASEVVPAVRLDDLADALGWTRVAAIKIDVEGAELAAITGLERILSRPDAPVVYYESNTHTANHAGTTVGQVVAALEGHGYRSYAVSAGRLTRVRPDEVQRDVVRDHLAVKGPLPSLLNLTIDEGRA